MAHRISRPDISGDPIGSWYFGGSDLETVYRRVGNSMARWIEHATAPGTAEQTTR